MGYQRDQPTDAMSPSHQVFPGKPYLGFSKSLSLTGPQEEEVTKLTKAGRSTSVSAEQAQAVAHYTENVWMQFDARGDPNQPVILDIYYALYPNSYPPSDFSPVLLQFLRWEKICNGRQSLPLADQRCQKMDRVKKISSNTHGKWRKMAYPSHSPTKHS